MNAPPHSLSTTQPRRARLGRRRLTRAHLLLSRRSASGSLGQAALTSATSALEQLLGSPILAKVRLLEGACQPSRVLPQTGCFSVFELAAEGDWAVLELELPLGVALLQPLSGQKPEGAPALRLTRIEEAALAYLHLTLLASLRELPGPIFALAPRLCAIEQRADAVSARIGQEGRYLSFELSLQIAEHRGSARLWVSAPALLTWLHASPEDVASQGSAEVMSANLPLRPFLGRSRLTAADLADLSPGDVVLLDETRAAQGEVFGPARLFGPSFELSGAFGPSGFGVTAARPLTPTQEYAMNELPPAPDLARLMPVDVEVELARVHLTLAELAGLRPGALLPLRVGVCDPVLLRVGDRAVARAELVDIDGELGARVLALLP